MHLYELSQAYKTLSVLVSDDEEFNTEALKEELAKVTTEFNDKVESIAKMVIELESDELALKNEIDRLSKHKDVATGKIKWFKSYLLEEMQNAKQDKVKGQVVTVSLRDNSKPTVNIIDTSKISHEYCKHVPESYVPDKELILAHMKETGEVVGGTEIITGKKYIVIK